MDHTERDESRTFIPVPAAPPATAQETLPTAASTPRFLWIGAYVVLMILVTLRLPLVNQHLRGQVPADVRAELSDDRLLSLSITVGTVLFILVYAVVVALYFSLSAFLDKRLVPGKALVGGRWYVGAFFVIPVLATIPVNLFSVAFGVMQPRDVPGYWFYFPLMAVVVLALFRRHWLGLPLGRKVLTVLSALGLSLVIALG